MALFERKANVETQLIKMVQSGDFASLVDRLAEAEGVVKDLETRPEVRYHLCETGIEAEAGQEAHKRTPPAPAPCVQH